VGLGVYVLLHHHAEDAHFFEGVVVYLFLVDGDDVVGDDARMKMEGVSQRCFPVESCILAFSFAGDARRNVVDHVYEHAQQSLLLVLFDDSSCGFLVFYVCFCLRLVLFTAGR